MKKRVIYILLLLSIVSQVMGYAHVGTVACETGNLAEVYRVLKANGLSDVAASAIAGNVARESGGDPASVEGGKYGRGIGVFQVATNGNRQALEDYCAGPDHASHPKVSLEPACSDKAYTVCNVVQCHVEAFLQDVAPTLNARKWSSYYTEQVQTLDILAQGVAEGVIPSAITVTNSWKGFKAQTDLFAATVQFMCDYETPSASSCLWVGINSYNDSEEVQQSFVDSVKYRYEAAVDVYNAYSGKKISPQIVPVVEEVVEPVVEEAAPIVEDIEVEPVPMVDRAPLKSAYVDIMRQAQVNERLMRSEKTLIADSNKRAVSGVRTMYLSIALFLLMFALCVCLDFWYKHTRCFIYEGVLLSNQGSIFGVEDYLLTSEVDHIKLSCLCGLAFVVDYLMISRVVTQLIALL